MLSTTMDTYISMVGDVSREAADKLDGWFDNGEGGGDGAETG
jgi:hypothetical protein